MNKSLVGLTAALCVITACASTQNGKNTSTSSAPADTLVGLVTEVGSDPGTWMSLRPAGGGQSVRLTGDSVATLRAVSRTEIWVSGARQLDEFRVDAFEVRKANDVAVDDGRVSVEQGKVYLTTRSGAKREVPNAPPQLLSMAGARIWVTRPVANQTPTVGVIRK